MIGLDTNLLVRLFTNDDKQQAKFAADIVEKNPVYISKSVLLETEWVLRYTYNLKSSIILDAFEKLLGLQQVEVEDTSCVLQALQWYRDNFDFADALHLASNHGIKKFATFDKKLIKKAKDFKINFVTL